MSTTTNTVDTSNQRYQNYNTAFIFLRDNKYDTGTYNNDSYDEVVLSAGTVMGRNTTTGKVLPLQSDASDGSQIPIGVLAQNKTVAAGEEVNLTYCTGGEVAKEKIVLAKSGDTLETVIDSRQLRDRIEGDTLGIKLIESTELTGHDNS